MQPPLLAGVAKGGILIAQEQANRVRGQFFGGTLGLVLMDPRARIPGPATLLVGSVVTGTAFAGFQIPLEVQRMDTAGREKGDVLLVKK